MTKIKKKYSYEAQHAKEKLKFIIKSVESFRIKHNRKPQNLKILDVGCGDGGISFPLAKFGYTIVATDSDADAIGYCNKANKFKNLKFISSDANSLDLKEKFDVIICSEVLEHLDKPSELIKRFPNYLKNNGIILITIPNGYGPFELLYNLYVTSLLKFIDNLRGLSRPGFYHVQHFTLQKISQLLNQSSIRIVSFRNSHFLSFLPVLRDSVIGKWDVKLAQKLPHWLASGWYFVCEKS